MKYNFFTLIFMISVLCLKAQQHSLEKLWQTDTVVAIPESVLPDTKKGVLFISLIDGGGWDADGKGGVGKLGIGGNDYNPTWITGLNAPKGMGRHGKRLYVADISEVVVINIKKGRIEKKIPIDSAKGLNDITVSEDGIVYVSDSRTSKIWRIEKDIPSLYLENMAGVNGLKAINNDLIIASGKSFIKADAQKKITKIVELPQGGDGIEPIGNGDFIVTAWSGYIFYVYSDGRFETLLESHPEKMNTADLGYDPKKRILYIPTFNAKKIVAYSLK